MKIAFFVSDLSQRVPPGAVHRGAEVRRGKVRRRGVHAFDGKSDSAVMTQNVDQVMAQGMDAATLHIWDYEAVKPGVLEALDKGIIMTSFFSPLGDTGIPTARSDEAGISFAMGAEMADAVEGGASRQADRDGAVGLAEPHRGQVGAYRSLRGGCSVGGSRRRRTWAAWMRARDRMRPSRSSWTW